MNQNWDAEDYHDNSSIQSSAAFHVLNIAKFQGQESVLDIGCGDGKITSFISKILTKGSVIGIDIAKKMIDFAEKKYSNNTCKNLKFICNDIQSLCFQEKFDIVFSSFVIQWIMDKRKFFKSIFNVLNLEGKFVVTIPLGISSVLEVAIKDIISMPSWIKYFESFSKNWDFSYADKYREFLCSSLFKIEYFSIVDHEVIFNSRNDFESYVKTWLVYLNYIPENLKPLFLKQIIDQYFKIQKISNSKKVKFNFPRLDFIVSKYVF